MAKIKFRNCTDIEAEYVIDKLVEYNLSQVPSRQENDFIYINKIAENEEGKIIGGILSKIYCWKCMYIDTLWIETDFRNQGLGAILLKQIENEALKYQCTVIHLDTFDFQAKDFYMKYGYEIFGILDDCPQNHKRYFLKKHL